MQLYALEDTQPRKMMQGGLAWSQMILHLALLLEGELYWISIISVNTVYGAVEAVYM